MPTLPPLGARALIILSLALALALTVVPMPEWARSLRPEWVALVLIYWCMAAPHQVGTGVAWLVGLLLDVVSGSLFGLHALTLLVAVFVIRLVYQRVRVAPLMQQALWVGTILLLAQAVSYAGLGATGRAPTLVGSFATVPVSALLWPWVFLILRDLRRGGG